MIVFEVKINGELVANAGNKDLESLDASLRYLNLYEDEGVISLDVDARFEDKSKGLGWVSRELKIGDEVSIKIVQSEEADEAVKTIEYDEYGLLKLEPEAKDETRYLKDEDNPFNLD